MAILGEANIYLSNVFSKDKKTGVLSGSLKTLKYSKEKKVVKNIKNFQRFKNIQQSDIINYNDYIAMDATFPIIKAALDIYSEEATCEGIDGQVLIINSENKKIKEELETLFFKVLKLNYNSHQYIRNTCKYGNTYCYIDCDEINGIKELIYLPNKDVRINNYNLNEQLKYNYFGNEIEPWQIVHWKNIEDLETFPYGTSILKPIVETWRRVVLMREALIIYRITRAPSRYLFKIDVTGLEQEEAERFVNDVQKNTSKQPLIDYKTGTINYAYNSLGIEENVYVPVDENSQTNVESLEGASNLDQVEDYKIIKDDLFAGLKIPKAWLTFEENLNSKSTLAGEDARFSRTTMKIQRQYIEGLTHLAIVHLYLKGYTEEELEDFEIKMFHPNTGLKQEQIELMKSKIDLFSSVWDKDNEGLNIMSYSEAAKQILDLPEEEIKQNIKLQFAEKKLIKKLKSLSESEDSSVEDENIENNKDEKIKNIPDIRIPKIRLEKKSLLEGIIKKTKKI